MMGGGFGGFFGFPWMGLLWVVVLAGGGYVLVRIATGRGRAGHRAAGGSGPEEVLKRRYARGEISREEYERMLGDLRR